MIVLYDPDTLLHDTVELVGAKIRSALESPARTRTIVEKLSESGEHGLRTIQSPLTSDDPSELKALLSIIERTHGREYLDHLKNAFDQWRAEQLIEQHENILPECFVYPTKAHSDPRPPKDLFARAGYFAFDMSSGIMFQTYRSVIASANLASESVSYLLDFKHSHGAPSVFALCRPPGHHCDGNRAGGYCYVNNVAVCISKYRSLSVSGEFARIGILDLDFHHGNGTQELYYSDPQVFYASIHGEDEFPYYTGADSETGAGDAVGANLNLPLATGSDFGEYMKKLNQALIALRDFRPEFLVVSLGFDTFHLDPLGSFQISTEHYALIAAGVRRVLADLPTVILLEGGYALEHLGENVKSFLEGWEARMRE
ncbi:hypothetical protein LTR37_009376 [Vermiconidia calcicola]|uniref:Uncharacterized protein n=1 Tax=Vermiconidia calcicola TaxID=1690605 RepID=A0ACC3N8K1_9PEZI|nr:hypothetical protein LTR37_009376 [Vermiconidia calcicola]